MLPDPGNIILSAYVIGVVLAATGVWKNPIFNTPSKKAIRILGWPWYIGKALISQEGEKPPKE